MSPRSEHHEQQLFFAEMAKAAYFTKDVRFKCVFAIPMGGKRDKITASNLKAEGARKGVPDVFLSVPSRGAHGLYIEFKKEGQGRLSDDQKKWRDLLTGQHYAYVVAYNHEQALEHVRQYLGEVAIP